VPSANTSGCASVPKPGGFTGADQVARIGAHVDLHLPTLLHGIADVDARAAHGQGVAGEHPCPRVDRRHAQGLLDRRARLIADGRRAEIRLRPGAAAAEPEHGDERGQQDRHA
jgi:hypothetical protein